jgi:hypothetical protein
VTAAAELPPNVQKAYDAWVKAADTGYDIFGGRRELTHYAALRRVDERIRRLKERYERLLREWKGTR